MHRQQRRRPATAGPARRHRAASFADFSDDDDHLLDSTASSRFDSTASPSTPSRHAHFASNGESSRAARVQHGTGSRASRASRTRARSRNGVKSKNKRKKSKKRSGKKKKKTTATTTPSKGLPSFGAGASMRSPSARAVGFSYDAEALREQLFQAKTLLTAREKELRVMRTRLGRAEDKVRQRERRMQDMITRGVERSGDPSGQLMAASRSQTLIARLMQQNKQLQLAVDEREREIEELHGQADVAMVEDMRAKYRSAHREMEKLRRKLRLARRTAGHDDGSGKQHWEFEVEELEKQLDSVRDENEFVASEREQAYAELAKARDRIGELQEALASGGQAPPPVQQEQGDGAGAPDPSSDALALEVAYLKDRLFAEREATETLRVEHEQRDAAATRQREQYEAKLEAANQDKAQAQRRVEELEAKCTTLESRIAALQEEMQGEHSRADNQASQIASLKADVEKAEGRAQDLQADLEQAQRELSEAEGRELILKKDLASANEDADARGEEVRRVQAEMEKERHEHASAEERQREEFANAQKEVEAMRAKLEAAEEKSAKVRIELGQAQDRIEELQLELQGAREKSKRVEEEEEAAERKRKEEEAERKRKEEEAERKRKEEEAERKRKEQEEEQRRKEEEAEQRRKEEEEKQRRKEEEAEQRRKEEEAEQRRKEEEVAAAAAPKQVAVDTPAEKEQPDSPPELIIHLLSADKLRIGDIGGKSDPFIVFHWEGDDPEKENVRSTVVKQSVNPTWGEDLRIPWKPEKARLVLVAYDEDRFSDPDYLGETSIAVDLMSSAQRSFALENRRKKSGNRGFCGSVTVSFTKPHDDDSDLDSIASAAGVEDDDPFGLGAVHRPRANSDSDADMRPDYSDAPPAELLAESDAEAAPQTRMMKTDQLLNDPGLDGFGDSESEFDGVETGDDSDFSI